MDFRPGGGSRRSTKKSPVKGLMGYDYCGYGVGWKKNVPFIILKKEFNGWIWKLPHFSKIHTNGQTFYTFVLDSCDKKYVDRICESPYIKECKQVRYKRWGRRTWYCRFMVKDPLPLSVIMRTINEMYHGNNQNNFFNKALIPRDIFRYLKFIIWNHLLETHGRGDEKELKF